MQPRGKAQIGYRKEGKNVNVVTTLPPRLAVQSGVEQICRSYVRGWAAARALWMPDETNNQTKKCLRSDPDCQQRQ